MVIKSRQNIEHVGRTERGGQREEDRERRTERGEQRGERRACGEERKLKTTQMKRGSEQKRRGVHVPRLKHGFNLHIINAFNPFTAGVGCPFTQGHTKCF